MPGGDSISQWYNQFMSANEIREPLLRQPFEPFRVITSGGTTYEMRHPEMAALGRSDPFIVMPETVGDEPYDRTVKIFLLHVVAIESSQAA